jgi:hypothetical protein
VGPVLLSSVVAGEVLAVFRNGSRFGETAILRHRNIDRRSHAHEQ